MRIAERHAAAWVALALLAALPGVPACGGFAHRDLPGRLAGLPQTFTARDGAGLDEVRRLHGKRIDLRSGDFAVYGGGAASLWVATARDPGVAGGLLREMTGRIARGGSPFTPDSAVVIGGREVHELTGMGQRHFYFQSGDRVVWLAVTRNHTQAALDDALGFYR